MQISGLRFHPVAIADPPLRSSCGLHAPYALRTIVEIETTDGIKGISETYGGEGPTAALEEIRSRPRSLSALEFVAQIVGHGYRRRPQPDPARAGRESPGQAHPNVTFAAVEIACLDAIGKAVGKPVCDLLGGRARDEVSFSAYLFYMHGGGGGLGDDPRADEYGECLDALSMVRQAKQMIGKYGFREIKLKGGVMPPEEEIATIRALREEFGPRYPLRIDPNCAWSVETSVGIGEALKDELSDGG